MEMAIRTRPKSYSPHSPTPSFHFPLSFASDLPASVCDRTTSSAPATVAPAARVSLTRRDSRLFTRLGLWPSSLPTESTDTLGASTAGLGRRNTRTDTTHNCVVTFYFDFATATLNAA